MSRFNYSDDDDMENFEKFSNRGKQRRNEDWDSRYDDKQKSKRLAEQKKKYDRRRHVTDDELDED